MDKKLAKNIFFSVICSLLLLGSVLGAVFGFMQKKDTTTAFNSTYTESANAVVVSEIWNGSTFDKTNTQTLLNMLCNSSSGSISTLSSKIGSGTINATTLRGYSSGGNTSGKSIIVTLGGFKWIVTYLFKDSSGNTCATLWMADANGTSTYGNSSSYYGGGSQWTSGYPASMYGTSYIAVYTLNNGGVYANVTSDSTITSAKSYTCSSSHKYAAFTHVNGGIRPYIVQPNKVPYQTTIQGKSYNGIGYALMNESLGNVSTSDLYKSSYTFEALDGYTNWGDDYLWLPSLSETGCSSSYPGLWATSQAERTNSNTYSWLRSCYYSNSRGAYSLYSSGDDYGKNVGVNNRYAVRPALHLNLTAVAEEASKVSITLDKQSGVGGSDSVYAYPGDAMSTIDTPVRTGYTFGGYYTSTNGGGTQYYNVSGASVVSTYPSGGPTVLYAKWTANTYYVKYEGNGADGGSMSNSTHIYDTASKLTKNAYTREGYTFAGWSASSTGAVAYSDEASISTLVSASGGVATLYAVWQANTYYVKYDANGGIGTMTNSTHTYDTASKLTKNAYIRVGYTFAGWSTTSTGAVAYSDEASISTLTSASGGVATIFAKWTANTYTVVYNANGGNGTMANSSHSYDVAKNLSKNTFTREGYRFLGWSTSNTATTPAYTDEQSVTNLATSGTVNLYAIWQQVISIMATVNDDEAGSVWGAGEYPANTVINLIAAVNPGYTLLYWAEVNSNGVEVSTFETNPLTITVTTEKRYQAVFGKSVEGISVSASKGGVAYIVGDDFEELGDDDTVTFATKLVLEGYAFSHWQDINGNNLGTEMSVKLKKSVVLDNIITAVYVKTTSDTVNQDTSN